jgi:DNA-directed RNA polymerase specialized sigma24 family protein
MSTVAWIAAEAERPAGSLGGSTRRSIEDTPDLPQGAQRNTGEILDAVELRRREASAVSGKGAAAGLGKSAEELENAAWALYEQQRERRIYRARTVAMLRRYMRYSIETGRLPSLVGREFFRSRITKYQMATFEDRVIFVHDMERCLEHLDDFGRQVLGRIVLQEYKREEAARLLGCTRMTVHRKLLESLDQLSDILLRVDLLDALTPGVEKTCQGGKEDDFLLSGCDDGK